MRVSQKVALVTGAADGIGAATAELLAEHGAAVVIGDIDDRGGTEVRDRILAAGGKAVFVHADISRPAEAASLASAAETSFGRLDILVNNAATFVLMGIDATPEDWHRSLDVNVIGTALVTHAAVQVMRRSGGGAIVNLASISSFVAQPQFVTYSATKAAILQMTRNLALDLASDGIRVNCVCPGTILTRASRDHMGRVGMSLADFIAAEAPKHLLNRVGTPREVAHAILFLASDDASFITGTHLMVDGGYTAV
ncbi:MAG: glucose 1-dehydrogenase [Vicinamibacteria bacterium]|nr:glucose 1-dehydrogenase [Vicinamibacteria bacterium]